MWYLSLSDIVHLVWSSLGPSCYCKWHYFVLFMANIPSYIYIHTQTPHICFTHSSVDGHLGCFHVLAIVNSAAINTGVHQIRSDKSLSRVRLFATPWITARQASLSITNFRAPWDSRPSSQSCHPAISSSVVPFSSCPQSLPSSESFPMSHLFAWGGQSTGVSALASFLPKKSQGWSQ